MCRHDSRDTPLPVSSDNGRFIGTFSHKSKKVRTGGRRRALTDKQVQHLKQLAADPNNSVEEIYKTFGISRMTFYRYVNSQQ